MSFRSDNVNITRTRHPVPPTNEDQVLRPAELRGTYARVLLSTPELDAAFERVVAGGAEVVQEPTEQPYGARDLAVRDPAGNRRARFAFSRWG
ncbi:MULTISPECIES: VOC family protein [Pseudonocardia]|uniref:VOC family protein n=1 Tax=Pseudonocardia TaxID=1847 RepID=UPI0022B25F21|nr:MULTISPECIES: VOC family protein [Pseudonocardia]